MKYKKTTLPNGFRVISVPVKGSATATVMIMVAAGSNHEKAEENGISHFLEHMVFKGTKTRETPLDISLELDGIGAENNAFTSSDFTGYYAKGGKTYWKKLLDVISDVYLNATLPKGELEKERGVILQEISMYEDLPHRIVQEEFAELMYGSSAPGRRVTGTRETVKTFSREDLSRYRARHYTPERTILVVAGDVDAKEIEKEAEKIFAHLAKGKTAPKVIVGKGSGAPALRVQPKETDQTHMVLGFRTYKANDKRTSPLFVLAGVLSAGMSSRLFKKLRDDLGACYYVRANNNAYASYGDFTISVGVERARVEEVVRVLLDEAQKLATELVSEAELSKVKTYLASHLEMSLETTDSLAEFYGLEEAIKGVSEHPEDIIRKMKAVTAKDVRSVAKAIFTDKNLHLAVVGRVEAEKKLKKTLRF